MSERSDIQDKILKFIEDNSNYFNGPFLIAGLQKAGKGKVRTIDFSVCATLDATVTIWSPKKIQVRGRGGLAHLFEGEYKSADQLIAHFRKKIK